MFEYIIGKAFKSRKTIYFILLVVLITGVYSYIYLPRQEFPGVDTPVGVLTVVYPGADITTQEKEIAEPIEKMLKGINGFDYVDTTIMYGSCNFVIWLDLETDPQKYWTAINEKLESFKMTMSDNVAYVGLETDLAKTNGFIYSVSGNENEIENFTGELEKIEGISTVSIYGKPEKDVMIEVDIEKLNNIPVSLSDIEDTISASNINIPLGEFKESGSVYRIEANSTLHALQEIENIPIYFDEQTFTVYHLGDIASIELKPVSDYVKIRYNSETSYLVHGYFEDGINITLLSEEINEVIEETNELDIAELVFLPEDVKESVLNFEINFLTAVILVLLSVLVGMGYRNSVIVAVTIPLSVLFTLAAMKVMGIELTAISIAGLIISLGMLVDNSIVVSDAIQTYIDNGHDNKNAAIQGVTSVASPILASTLTTVLAFSPLIFLPGIAGEFVKSLPIVVIIALSASYLAAIFVTPIISSLMLKKKKKRKLVKLKKMLEVLLRGAINYRIVTLLILLVVLVGAGFLATNLELEFFPKAQKGIFYIDISLEADSTENNTLEKVKEIEEILKDKNEVDWYCSSYSGELVKFYTTVAVGKKGENIGQMLVGTKGEPEEDFYSNLQDDINNKLGKRIAKVKRLEIAEPQEAPIEIRLTSDSIDELEKGAKDIISNIEETKGLKDVYLKSNETAENIKYTFDFEKASQNNLVKAVILDEISRANLERAVSKIAINGSIYDIYIKGDASEIEDLLNLHIKKYNSDQKASIKDYVDYEYEEGLYNLYKYNEKYYAKILGTIQEDETAVSVMRKIKDAIDEDKYENISIIYEGEMSKISTYFGNVGISALIAVLLIFIVLIYLFRSYRQSMIILISLPMAAVGSVLLLYITKQKLSFTALLGVVALFGIVVNNAIVLVDYINSLKEQGKEIKEICIIAVKRRMRPILLSTITTIIGLIPLSISKDPLFVPLAIALLGGLLLSTVLTIIVIPVLTCRKTN